ncbi:MAG: hypothetical protein RR356_02640 [Bacteroidales bacterium]
MFIRKLKNRSGSISVQIIFKSVGKYKIIKTIGCATTQQKTEELEVIARSEIEKLTPQPKLFDFETDGTIEQAFLALSNASIRTLGPDLIFGKIYDYVGFGAIQEELFHHLVISRLAFPLSKLKTCKYLYCYQ